MVCLSSRKLVVLGLIAAAALVARVVFLRLADERLAAQRRDPNARGPEQPERRFSLEDDIVGDLYVPDYLMPYVDPVYHPYRATDFFTDPKVAKLAEAARDGDVRGVDAFADSGVDVNARGRAPQMNGLTPLMYAMSGKTLAGFQRLLERGANPNVLTDEATGVTSALDLAATRKDPEAMRILLSNRGDPNLPVRDRDGSVLSTPIFTAIQNHRVEQARMLIKAGADVNCPATLGRPLRYAETFADYDIMYQLLEARADFRAKDDLGWSLPMHLVWYEAREIRDPRVVAARNRCIGFLERSGVDFAKERENLADYWRRRGEEARKAASGLDGAIPQDPKTPSGPPWPVKPK